MSDVEDEPLVKSSSSARKGAEDMDVDEDPKGKRCAFSLRTTE